MVSTVASQLDGSMVSGTAASSHLPKTLIG